MKNTAEYKNSDGQSLSLYMVRANDNIYDYECFFAENDDLAISFSNAWAEAEGFKITEIYKKIWEG